MNTSPPSRPSFVFPPLRHLSLRYPSSYPRHRQGALLTVFPFLRRTPHRPPPGFHLFILFFVSPVAMLCNFLDAVNVIRFFFYFFIIFREVDYCRSEGVLLFNIQFKLFFILEYCYSLREGFNLGDSNSCTEQVF